MISPQEIRTVTFDKVMRGYRPEDVDALLQQLAQQMEQLQAEKESTEKKLYVLAQKVEEYRKDEDNLKTALLNAQRMGENVIKEAKQKAESILREAGIKAEDITRAALEQVNDEQLELERVKAEVAQFKNSVLSLYKQHIESLSTLPGDEPEEAEEEEIPAPVEQAEPEQAAPVEEPEAPAEADPFEQGFDAPEEPDDPISRFPDLSALYGAPAAEEPAQTEEEEEPTRTFVPGASRAAAPQPETPPASSLFEGFEGIKFSD
ncbi:MAG TPA: DivIVA domain-containing protein [Candidatus Fournierella merdipullorum]|uniref:DivIVA domain-containing protein n=1 Tax=Candidatus Allofournierella merdipullorum TaxID=2838595 RepID=A0A9D2E306_9FIRM|nr:DivIVA domain-containing protein [Candidatus Fournierella merdipullorum]HIZ30004.1 DivIVA domain-containing protein [Candidatus Fournierella merdipullorum]